MLTRRRRLYTARPLCPRRAPARRRRGNREVRLLSSSSRQSPLADEQGRFSPERAYRPRVSPPSVEDRDACAIYASVRKDATPSRAPVELALANLQKMLHRAGNVDGEGDGCGILVDIPRRIWAEEVRSGGHNPALALDPAFAVAHVFIERSADVERARHDAREILGRGGFRILAERLGVVDSQALGATAREEEPHFWQVAGLLPDAKRRERLTFDLMSALETELGFHLASFSASTCVYKVMGAPRVLGEYYPDLRDERFETIGCFGHNRYSTNTWPSFKRVQPFTVLGHNGEINTIEQLRQEAAHARRLDPARLLRLPGPEPGGRPPDPGGAPLAPRGDGDDRAPDRGRDPLAARRAAALLHVPAPDDGPVRPGPGGADRPPRRRVRVLGRRARPAPAVEARDARRLHLQLRARSGGLRPDGLRAKAPRPRREVHGHDRPREAVLAAVRALGDAARGRQAVARAHRRLRDRAVRSRAGDRRPPGGRRDPRLHLGRPLGAGQGLRQGAGRLRLAARRRQALPADGLQRGRADRLARLRRAAGRALAGAPEPRRLLQGDRRRGHQPGDRPRARDRALLDPGRVRAPALGPRPGRRHADDRDLLPGDPRRPPRPGAPLRLDLPQDRPRAQDLPARGPVGGVPRPRRGDRHRAAGVGDHPRRDRAHQAGGREAGSPRRRAPRAHRPHRVRRRAPLPRPPPGDLRGRPGPEAAQGRRDRRGEPQAPLLDRAALGGDPQRPRRRHGARAGRQRRLPVRDGRGDLRRGLRRRRLQPLLGAAQGDREGDLDDRHPRGARLRAPVLLDRGEAGAGRDLPVRDLLRF